MVIDNILNESGNGVSRTYLIPEDPDKILVPDTRIFQATQIIIC